MTKDNQWVVIITNIIGKTSFPGYSTRLIQRMGSILPCCLP